MKLSVNLNKIALLRNARGENYPDLEYFANMAIDLGVNGLTLHPRPDHRHATSEDVIRLAKISKEREVEFNIEGNPFSHPNKDFLGFCELVEMIQPDQITLVPDTINQITSDHGWMRGPHDNKLRHSIKHLREKSVDSKISLFVDDINGVEYAHDMQVDLIEIHTGKFSNGIQKNDMSVIGDIRKMIDFALDKNLLINAGHGLNLNNLHYLVEIGNINEVSIGHAIIIESLNYGFENTISKYLDIIRK
jgi:pyridoxine 5-phosphate synthase